MSTRKRALGLNIRVTEQEKMRILRNARRCKLTSSEYLRQLAYGYAPKELPNDRLYDLCWQVELLSEDRRYVADEKFKSYLVSFLQDTQKILHGQQELTETEIHTLSMPEECGVHVGGDDQNMASS